ncbi:unnamed protein product [Prorocentrum cordatum]|uniref:Uncharacterized protein n=1 Tax=Prorocentrum cordatum TaxID=2364126 RepID=A0ABN9QVM6_9DINO|nr:unnamed protein product [Polarella glacialis]
MQDPTTVPTLRRRTKRVRLPCSAPPGARRVRRPVAPRRAACVRGTRRRQHAPGGSSNHARVADPGALPRGARPARAAAGVGAAPAAAPAVLGPHMAFVLPPEWPDVYGESPPAPPGEAAAQGGQQFAAGVHAAGPPVSSLMVGGTPPMGPLTAPAASGGVAGGYVPAASSLQPAAARAPSGGPAAAQSGPTARFVLQRLMQEEPRPLSDEPILPKPPPQPSYSRLQDLGPVLAAAGGPADLGAVTPRPACIRPLHVCARSLLHVLRGQLPPARARARSLVRGLQVAHA